MDGVRISGVKQDITKENLLKYFNDIVGTCGHVSKVYYPLMKNDAVIIFSNTEAVQELHSQSHKMFTVYPLPHEVFTKVQVWVDSKISALLWASKQELTNEGGVEIGWDEATQAITLRGKMYEVEWAQKYLSDKCDNLSRIHSALITGRGGVDVIRGVKSLQLTNGDRIRDMSARGEQYSQPSLEECEWSRRNENVACSSCDYLSLNLPASKPSSSASSLDTKEPTATCDSEWVKQNSSLTKIEINHSMHHHDGESKILSSEHGDKERFRQQNSDTGRLNSVIHSNAEMISPSRAGQSPHSSLWEEEDKRISGLSQSPLPPTMGCGISGPSTGDRSKDMRYDEFNGPATDHRTKDMSDTFIGACGGELSDDELNGAYGGELLLGSEGTALFLPTAISADLIARNFSINSQLKLKIYCEDIVRVKTDAVVSPANSQLHNIGGVARALEYAAGPEMQDQCSKIVRKMGRLMTTQVVETKACGRLGHLKYVFHAVGPIVSVDDEKSIYELSETFINCLELADKLCLRSIAFPFISTGIFGMSTDHCVLALITAVLAFPEICSCISLNEVHFVHNDVNVVGEAIILADQQLENEDKESAKQRLQQGRQLYRRYDASPYSLSFSSSSYRQDDRGRQRPGTMYGYSSLPSTTLPKKENYPSSYSRESSCHDDLDIQLLSTSTSGQTRRRSGSLDRGKGTSSLTSQKNESSPAPRPSSSLAPRRSVTRAHSFTSHLVDATTLKKTGVTGVRPEEGAKTKMSPYCKQTLTTRTIKQSKYEPHKTGTVKKSAPESLTTKTTHLSRRVSQESTSSSSSRSSRKQLAEMASKKGRYSNPSSTSDTDTSETADGEDSDDVCPVCLQKFQSPKKLKCGHVFCLLCIDQAMKFKPRCPKCQYNYGIQTGSQPLSGRMTHRISLFEHIPGFPPVGSIIIDYDFPSGMQEACHPNPGKWYSGTHRTAYLPNTPEGLNILQMLKKAFDNRLVFTIGDSRTTGANDVITWNDIHHKTSIDGGPEYFGYPDAGYLIRVKEELAAKGITSP